MRVESIGLAPARMEDGYIPYLAASERGVINPEKFVIHDPQAANNMALNMGIIPEKGGLIGHSGQVEGAIDLVRLEWLSEHELVMRAADKYGSVDDKDDRIKAQGGLVLSKSDGRIVHMANAIDDTLANGWNAPVYRQAGRVALSRISGLSGARVFEAQEVESETGLVRARAYMPRAYFC